MQGRRHGQDTHQVFHSTSRIRGSPVGYHRTCHFENANVAWSKGGEGSGVAKSSPEEVICLFDCTSCKRVSMTAVQNDLSSSMYGLLLSLFVQLKMWTYW